MDKAPAPLTLLAGFTAVLSHHLTASNLSANFKPALGDKSDGPVALLKPSWPVTRPKFPSLKVPEREGSQLQMRSILVGDPLGRSLQQGCAPPR